MSCKKCKCKVCSCIKNDVPKIAVNGIVQNQNENDVVNIKVPTKTSQLINDSGFGQGGGLESNLDYIRVNGDLAPIINKVAQISVPTKTSDIINDSDYTTKYYVDEEVGRVIDINTSGILGSINPSTNTSSLEDGVYRAEVEGTYTNASNIVVKEGYYTLLRKDNGVWKLESEVEMPKLSAEGKVEEGNTEAVSGGEVYSSEQKLMPKSYFESFPKSIGKEVLVAGKFIRPNGVESVGNGYMSTDFIPIPVDSDRIRVKTTLMAVSVSPLVFFDSNYTYISGVSISETGDSNEVYDIPHNARYFKSSCNNAVPARESYEIGFGVVEVVTAQDVDEKIKEATSVYVGGIFDTSVYVNNGFYRPNGTIGTGSVYTYSNPIDLTGLKTLELHTILNSPSVSPAVFFDENMNYISGYTGVATESDYNIPIPENAKYLITSIFSTGKTVFQANGEKMIKYVQIDTGAANNKKEKIFISTSGNDLNTGLSISTPIKTIAKAIEMLSPSGELVFLEGDYIDYSFSLSSFSKLTGIGNVRIIRGILKVTNEDPAVGFNRVFQAPFATNIGVGAYLYQHDIADEQTVISNEERHPLHRGRRTRLPSTRIYPATSVEEIQSTTNRLMWYQQDGVLYFSKADGSSLETNPVIVPGGVFTSVEKKSVEIRNLNFMYCGLLTTNLTGLFENVVCGMVNTAGAIRYDNTVGLLFRNCEVYACSNDGFNGHTSVANGYTRTSVIFDDCYAHDNSDDGESCHEYSDVIHKGGLYEYNGNAITPASGGHAVCYNVLARRHGDYTWTTDKAGTGFSAQGVSLDDGIGTNIYCFGCVSENNQIGFRGITTGSKAYNCISKNDVTAFGTTVEQINCTIL